MLQKNLTFKMLDRTAQCWLGDIQALSGTAEVQLLRYGCEVTNVAYPKAHNNE